MLAHLTLRVLRQRTTEATSQEVAAEASALPVSTKPVTLSFKGGLSMSKLGQSGPSKKPVPLSQAFSMDDAAEGEGDTETNDTAAAEDPKGLFGCWETSICASWLTVYRMV